MEVVKHLSELHQPVQHTKEDRPRSLTANSTELRFGDLVRIWISELLEDGRNFSIDAFLKAISRVESLV